MIDITITADDNLAADYNATMMSDVQPRPDARIVRYGDTVPQAIAMKNRSTQVVRWSPEYGFLPKKIRNTHPEAISETRYKKVLFGE